MGMWKNCKKCGKEVYLLQKIDGSWACYVDDYCDVLHTCEKRLDNTIHLGNIFEIGSCSRRIVYKALGTWGEYDYNYKAWEAFYIGRAGESYIKDMLHKMGYKFVVKQKDVNFLGFTGRIDGLILINNKLNLLECKTISDFAKYNAFVKSNLQRDHPSYYAQIQSYMAATKSTNCLLIILGDDLYEVQIPFDHAAVEALREKAEKVREAVITESLPQGDPYKKPVLECSYCPYQSHCDFSEANLIGDDFVEAKLRETDLSEDDNSKTKQSKTKRSKAKLSKTTLVMLCGGAETVKPLIKALESDPDDIVRETAATILSGSDTQEAAEALTAILRVRLAFMQLAASSPFAMLSLLLSFH